MLNSMGAFASLLPSPPKSASLSPVKLDPAEPPGYSQQVYEGGKEWILVS